MFVPVDIIPIPRRGSLLALLRRGILVAAVVMVLVAILAAYAGSETLGALSPSPVQTEQTSAVTQPPGERP